jgi:hypothetical protein
VTAQDSDEFDVPEREVRLTDAIETGSDHDRVNGPLVHQQEVVDEGQSPASGSIPPQFAARPAVTTVLKSMIPFQRRTSHARWCHVHCGECTNASCVEPDAAENFVIEASILGFLFVFFANYFLGKRQNRALVDKWCVDSLESARYKQPDSPPAPLLRLQAGGRRPAAAEAVLVHGAVGRAQAWCDGGEPDQLQVLLHRPPLLHPLHRRL